MLTPLIFALPLSVAMFFQAAEQPQAREQPHVFDIPALQAKHLESQRVVTVLFARGEYAESEKILREAIERIPHDPNSHYNLACALARQDKKDDALTMLGKAVDLGFRDAQHIGSDEDLQDLREEDRFKEIVEEAGKPLKVKPEGWRYQVEPATRQDGQVLVSERNTAWNAQVGVFRTFFNLEPESTADEPIAIKRGEAGNLLRAWNLQGTAAGNHGDLYDNHDGDHSNMDFKSLPQLTRIEFSEEARERRLNIGVQLSFLYNGITIGNSSMAASGVLWRSQARQALTHPRGPMLLYLQYVGNHMYLYPEHRDHDPQMDGSGYGDVFPANTPYMIISQGSSGSDRVFMNAIGSTLAAFRPDVKQKLAKSGALMPTLQMIFRLSNKKILSYEDYLAGKAHPTVFEGKQVDELRMVSIAHEMKADLLPPIVQLKVVEEDESIVGRDYFDVGSREKLLNTPCAISRVIKSSKYSRRMVVTAEASKDLDGKPLTFRWILLRGDPDRVQIKKLDETGSRAELIVDYHERRPIAPGSKLESNRVDIGVFAHNGRYYSAPGFVCFYYLNNEKRVYDQQHRIQTVDYADPQLKDNYVDPVLDYRKDWRDEYRYTDDGELQGWTRIRGTERQEFTADGLLILKKDAAGEVIRTTRVRYVAKKSQPRAAATLEQVVASPAD